MSMLIFMVIFIYNTLFLYLYHLYIIEHMLYIFASKENLYYSLLG